MERKTLWILKRDLRVKQISAIYDNTKKKVVAYCHPYPGADQEEDPTWYSPEKDETFYATEQEALKAKKEKQEYLKSKFEEVKKFVDLMDDIESTDDFQFEKTDYLPRFLAEPWERAFYEEYENKYGTLVQYIRTGMLNINGDSFRKEDVVRIEWAEKTVVKQGKKDSVYVARLVLKDGKKVETSSEEEYDIITDIFGENNSGQVYDIS